MKRAMLGVTAAGCNEENVSTQGNSQGENIEEDMFEYETGGIDPDLEYLDDEELGAEPDVESNIDPDFGTGSRPDYPPETGSENEELGK